MSSKYSKNRTTETALKAKLLKGFMNWGGDILRLSTAVTPFKDGDLRIRRRVTPIPKGARVQWLAGHAAVQNQGSRRGRPFRHYTTAETGPHFVEAGIKATKPYLTEYFK